MIEQAQSIGFDLDGVSVVARGGESILKAAQRAGHGCTLRALPAEMALRRYWNFCFLLAVSSYSMPACSHASVRASAVRSLSTRVWTFCVSPPRMGSPRPSCKVANAVAKSTFTRGRGTATRAHGPAASTSVERSAASAAASALLAAGAGRAQPARARRGDQARLQPERGRP